VWGLVFSLHGAIFSIFLGSQEFNFGIWKQSESITIGLHFCATLAAMSLAAIAYSTKKLGILAWHPIVLLPLSLALWSFLVGLTHDFPSLDWFGSPVLGEGVLWFLELGLFTAAAGIVKRFRLARYFLAGSAIGVVCILTALTIRFLNTGTAQFVPFFYSDYLAFLGVYVIAIAVTFLRGTNRLILIAAVIAGLAVVYYSDNRAALGIVFVAAPVIALAGLFLARYVSLRILRGAAVVAIVMPALVVTTVFSTVDIRSSVQKLESFGVDHPLYLDPLGFVLPSEKGIAEKLHSGLMSLASRQHLTTVSVEAIAARPSSLALGQGWGMFSDHFAINLPVGWVKLRDDNEEWTESEKWLLERHWDAVNRVDFHGHNSHLEALLSVGIIGALLFLGIIVAPVLWCRRKFVIIAGTFGFASSGLFAQWFQLPGSMPLLALALGGFITPVQFRWYFPTVKKIAPWIWAGFAALLLISGSVALKFTPYAHKYMPPLTLPLATQKGRFVCSSKFEDQGRGGYHLAYRLRAVSKYVKNILVTDDKSKFEHIKYLRGLVCDSESYIDRRARITLLIAALHTRSDFAFIDIPNEMKPLFELLMQTWGSRVRELLARAPKRTDLATPYMLYLLKSGAEKKFANLATSLFVLNQDDPIALWFSGIALLSKSNMGDVGIQRMRTALRNGVERLIPIDQDMKRQLVQ
jgi:hypothetical protein